jgi:DNA polymerase-3 subunit delta'
MLDDYRKDQSIAYKILTSAVDNNKLSHAYLFETNNYTSSKNFIMAFVKYILCPEHHKTKEEANNCNVCKRIDNGNYTELKIIFPDGMWIKKDQIEELQREFETKAVESNKKVYIIFEADKLNNYAANALLKFLEEPESGIIAILVTNNKNLVLRTIQSRCQIISLQNDSVTDNKNLLINEKFRQALIHINNNYSEYIETEKFSDLINETINFLLGYEEKELSMIANTSNINLVIGNDKNTFELFLAIMVLIYQDLINFKLNRQLNVLSSDFEYINKFDNLLITTICNRINIIEQIKNNIKINANINLLLDKLIIMFSKEEV